MAYVVVALAVLISIHVHFECRGHLAASRICSNQLLEFGFWSLVRCSLKLGQASRQDEMAGRSVEPHIWKLSGPKFALHGKLQTVLLPNCRYHRRDDGSAGRGEPLSGHMDDLCNIHCVELDADRTLQPNGGVRLDCRCDGNSPQRCCGKSLLLFGLGSF